MASENSPESRVKPTTIKFNPPAMVKADTQYVPGHDFRGSPKAPDRARNINGANTLVEQDRSTILSRKGWFAPDTTFPADFSQSTDSEDETQAFDWSNLPDMIWPDNFNINPLDPFAAEAWWPSPDVKDPALDDAGKPQEITYDTIFDKNRRYGFRFMYNPVQLGFHLGVTAGVNTSYILSGHSTAIPATDTDSSLTLSFPISRTEDIAILRNEIEGWSTQVRPENVDVARLQRLYDNSVNLPRVPYGVPAFDSGVTAEDLVGIATRGTMYDLEFMFRSFLGRQWKTYYRGYTADVGLAFSYPMVIYLSPTMVYRVRLAGVDFTHRVFTPDMVPTYTEVSLGFERLPDVTSFA